MRTYISATVMQLEHLHDSGVLDVLEILPGLNYWMTPEWREFQDEVDEELLEYELTQMALNQCREAQKEMYPDQELAADFPRVVLVAEHPDLWVRTLDAESAVALVSSELRHEFLQAIFVGFSDDASELSWFGPTELHNAIEWARMTNLK